MCWFSHGFRRLGWQKQGRVANCKYSNAPWKLNDDQGSNIISSMKLLFSFFFTIENHHSWIFQESNHRLKSQSISNRRRSQDIFYGFSHRKVILTPFISHLTSSQFHFISPSPQLELIRSSFSTIYSSRFKLNGYHRSLNRREMEIRVVIYK